MSTPLIAAIVQAVPLVTIDSQAALSIILSKLVPIVLGGIGLLMLLNARKQRMSALLEDVGKIIIIGVVITGGGLLLAFGDSISKVILH